MQPCNKLVTALQSCNNLSTTKLQPYKIAAILFFCMGSYSKICELFLVLVLVN